MSYLQRWKGPASGSAAAHFVITHFDAYQDGALSRITSWGVDVHMGTQYGLFTRILATAACLALLTSIASAFVMWWKRRPTGTAGLPGRSSEASRANTPRGAVLAIGVIATSLAVLYPSFGVSLIVVLIAESIIESRRTPALKRADHL